MTSLNAVSGFKSGVEVLRFSCFCKRRVRRHRCLLCTFCLVLLRSENFGLRYLLQKWPILTRTNFCVFENAFSATSRSLCMTCQHRLRCLCGAIVCCLEPFSLYDWPFWCYIFVPPDKNRSSLNLKFPNITSGNRKWKHPLIPWLGIR